ncbi:hypothetical protein [Streptomyces sp. enrichment culture]|uniref:hypothetical protein n=1 Tax=Streptomyces sp. enrichment culture TaxID=1795815 RepID=UPI003F5641A1
MTTRTADRPDTGRGTWARVTPGAPREEYVERVAETAQRGGEELRRFRVRHDSHCDEELEGR